MTDPPAGDYLITAVHYNPQQTHIEAAEVLIDDGQSIGDPTDLTRERIITMLGEGHRFITVQLNGRDWHRDATVQAVTTDSNIWIRADTHRIDADDLGALPGYEPRLREIASPPATTGTLSARVLTLSLRADTGAGHNPAGGLQTRN